MPARRTSRRRLARSTIALRWVGALVLIAVAVGYVRPIEAYREARAEVDARKAEVARTAKANAALERRIARAGTAEVVERQARRLGFVRPGERLFIVTGIDEWKRARRAAERVGVP